MVAWMYAENLLFFVFRWYNCQWRYINQFSASSQPAFNAREGAAITRDLGQIRNIFFQKLIDDGVDLVLTEVGFNDAAIYASNLYPTRDKLLTRLVCIACLGVYFVHYQINDGRLWAFRNIWVEISEYDIFLASQGA